MDVSELQLWTVLGILSTGSHGFFLLLTAPMWTIAGAVATSVASYAPRIISTDPVALQPFARFPQGFPPGFDRTTLQSKPWIIPGERRLRQ